MRLVKGGALQQGCPSPRPVSGPAGAFQPEIRTSRVGPGGHASVREEARAPRPATEDGISGGKQRVHAGQSTQAASQWRRAERTGATWNGCSRSSSNASGAWAGATTAPPRWPALKSRRRLHVFGRNSIPRAPRRKGRPVSPARRPRALSRESPTPARSARHWLARRVGSCRRTPRACGARSRAALLTCCMGRQPMRPPCSAVPRWRLSVQRQMSPASGLAQSPLARPNSRPWPVRRGSDQGRRHRNLRPSTCWGRRPNSAHGPTNTMSARSDGGDLSLLEGRARRAPGARGEGRWSETRVPDPRDSRQA